VTKNRVDDACVNGKGVEDAGLTGRRVEGADLTGKRVENASVTGKQVQDARSTGRRVEGASLTGKREVVLVGPRGDWRILPLNQIALFRHARTWPTSDFTGCLAARELRDEKTMTASRR
jgi:hypothetical protein